MAPLSVLIRRFWLAVVLPMIFHLSPTTNAVSLDHDVQQRSMLEESTLPFLLVWRLEVNSAFDRQPKMREYGGVAQATAQWLTDTLPILESFNSAQTSLKEVMATVSAATWDPSRSIGPHTISLNCLVVLENEQRLSTDHLSELIGDIGRDELSAFVTQYIRIIGPSTSVFQYTSQPATFVSQVSSMGNGNAPQPAPIELTPASPAASPSAMGAPQQDRTGGTFLNPVLSPAAAPTAANGQQPTPAQNPMGSLSSNNNVFSTTPGVFSYGGTGLASRGPTPAELAGLLESTRSFLESSLQAHYAQEAPRNGAFVGVTMEWTETEFLSSSTLSHVLRADIHLWYHPSLPTEWVDYYIFLLTDMLGGANTPTYVLNHVRQSSDSIYRSVQQFTFDFRV
ncbi:expressed unknown protein [Seminavis robusta]|uniref:Uncharacterized protein n=1 Tax=Seminavis robusta TaxID=568900 RepID=A0A9N8EEP7_9STRA|nr:expressed unknown protein [Seminavis robusta]|eukprot:Sro1072_g238070.1 n/a (396) ;mRNA; f:13936-15123